MECVGYLLSKQMGSCPTVCWVHPGNLESTVYRHDIFWASHSNAEESWYAAATGTGVSTLSSSLVPKPWLTDSLVRRFAAEFILPVILETDLANYPIRQTKFWHRISPKILLDSLMSHCAQKKLDTAAHLAPQIQIARCFLFLGDLLQRWLQLQVQNTLHTGFKQTVFEKYRPSISVTHSRNCEAIYFHQLHLIKNTQQKCTDTLYEK